MKGEYLMKNGVRFIVALFLVFSMVAHLPINLTTAMNDDVVPLETKGKYGCSLTSESAENEESLPPAIENTESPIPIATENKEEVSRTHETNEEEGVISTEDVDVTSELATESQAGEIAPRTVVLGNSVLTADYQTGACGQGVGHIAFTYTAVLGLTINDNPLIILGLPAELASQLNPSPTKKAAFLASLTGTVTYPSSVLSNTTIDLHATTTEFTLSYDVTNSAVVLTFKKNTLSLGIASKWATDVKFDTVALYKKGISIPPASNGTSYAVKGNFTDLGGGINLLPGNQLKSGVISSATMPLGTCPVLPIQAPIISSLVNNQSSVSGSVNQTQDSNYVYTVNLNFGRVDGTAIPVAINGVAVAANGTFTTAIPAALEYLDTVSAVVIATAKVGTDLYQSTSSTATVSWPISPPVLSNLAAGANQVVGTAIQAVGGNYKMQLQINNDPTRTQSSPLPGNGSFNFSLSQVLQGGDSVTVKTQGYSNRTGLLLVESSAISQTVAYTKPSLTIVQVIEKMNSQGTWETATAAVTGQTIRYTITTTLTNTNAKWNQSSVRNWIPAGLSNLTSAQMSKKDSVGTITSLGAPQLVTDGASPSTQAWNYQGAPASYLQQSGESLILQYVATISGSALNTSLLNSTFINGTDGGGTAIPQQSSQSSLPVGNGTLRFIQAPATIEFQNLKVPAKQTIYNATTVPNPLIVADGRVIKSQWRVYVKEAKALTSASGKVLTGAFIYSKNGGNQSVNQDNLEIFSYTSLNDNNVPVNWQANEGIRLNLTPSPNLNVNESYQGKLDWVLSDGPI